MRAPKSFQAFRDCNDPLFEPIVADLPIHHSHTGSVHSLGFSYGNGTWHPPVAGPSQALPLIAEADAMHAALVRRTDALTNCLKGFEEEAELRVIADALQAYEAKRWPRWKEAGKAGASKCPTQRSRGTAAGVNSRSHL
jgi:hypothetical protein